MTEEHIPQEKEKELTPMQVREYKMGSNHPTDENLVFWSYNKQMEEYWITKEQFNRWRGYDELWSVYYLPKENYYGATRRLARRMKEHRKNGRDTN